MSAEERTNWRDEKISKRHRQYGFNCPCVDIDFPYIEYNTGRPVALIEYKARPFFDIDLSEPNYTAPRILADNSNIPYFIAFYNTTTWTYTVRSGNRQALQYFEMDERMSEQEYVKRLYMMRNKVVPEYILEKLHSIF